ncbi:hypothetical protein [Variovorax sp. UMC13]|uniref:hypothetical protein n=1 Tax=Variovorax sp. UMC13 TaxID=1862326 RepID=UPI001C7EAD70|nr:hypothetical protein [Variovorax sp. UMC13]
MSSVDQDDATGGAFEHRLVDAVAAPRPAGLGPNSPFAMAARYLGLSEDSVAAAPPRSAETAARATAVPPLSSAPVEPSGLPATGDPFWCSFYGTGAIRLAIGDQQRFVSPAQAKRLADRLAAHAQACAPITNNKDIA